MTLFIVFQPFLGIFMVILGAVKWLFGNPLDISGNLLAAFTIFVGGMLIIGLR